MKTRIFFNSYADPVPARDAELKLCLKKNRECKSVDEVVLMDGRPTFNQFFARIAEVAGPDDISIIINSDVWLNGTIDAAKSMRADEAYTLTRWDVQAVGDPIFFGRKDSADTWIIRGKPRPMKANFGLGIPGCDNRIAAILADAGYVVSNPSLTIRTYHVHLSEIRRQGKMPWQIIPKPYLLIEPHMLGIEPKLSWCR